MADVRAEHQTTVSTPERGRVDEHHVSDANTLFSGFDDYCNHASAQSVISQSYRQSRDREGAVPSGAGCQPAFERKPATDRQANRLPHWGPLPHGHGSADNALEWPW